jgi:hypothetical protein|uniref:Uncharacterized protein n=1 Tax=Bacteroides coprosuis TaxID=151276 RepID=Q7WT00_9BACE|nr:hypothetical protein [Bacteroides coprosuis DSM 18011]
MKKNVAVMRKERIKLMKQNSLASGILIKFLLRLVVVGVCVLFLYRSGVALGVGIGGYLMARCVLKVIRLSIRLVFTILSILFLLTTIAILTTIIF